MFSSFNLRSNVNRYSLCMTHDTSYVRWVTLTAVTQWVAAKQLITCNKVKSFSRKVDCYKKQFDYFLLQNWEKNRSRASRTRISRVPHNFFWGTEPKKYSYLYGVELMFFFLNIKKKIILRTYVTSNKCLRLLYIFIHFLYWVSQYNRCHFSKQIIKKIY